MHSSAVFADYRSSVAWRIAGYICRLHARPKEFGLPASWIPRYDSHGTPHALALCFLRCLRSAWTGGLVGCDSSPERRNAREAGSQRPDAARPSAASERRSSDADRRRLEYTYDHRRLSVGTTDKDQAAWQIIHGALAFKREFLVSDGRKDVSAVDYVLAGGR